MAIYCDPFPSEGADQCPSVSVAARIIQACVNAHGRNTPLLDELFPDLEWVPATRTAPPRWAVKAGVGIRPVRDRISRLWRAMGAIARALFLQVQEYEAVRYLDRCRALLLADDVSESAVNEETNRRNNLLSRPLKEGERSEY